MSILVRYANFYVKNLRKNNDKMTQFHWSRKSRDSCPTSGRTFMSYQTCDCVITLTTTNNRYGQRRCPEAWHINMSRYAVNRDDGNYLHKNISIFLVNGVISRGCIHQRCNIRSLLTTILDRSIKTLGRE